MKMSLKSIALLAVFMILSSGLFASMTASSTARTPGTASTNAIDPDATVYNALQSLVNNVLTLSSTDLTTLQNLIPTAHLFLDGTTSPAVTLSNLDTGGAWLTTINNKIASTGFTSDVNKIASSSSPLTAISTVLTNYATTTGLPAADVTTLYNAIIAATNATLNQTAANLPTYLSTLTPILTTASTSAIFGSQAKTSLDMALGIINNINKIDTTGICGTPNVLYILETPTTIKQLSNLIENTTFKGAAQQWRIFKQTPLS